MNLKFNIKIKLTYPILPTKHKNITISTYIKDKYNIFYLKLQIIIVI